MSEGWAQQRRGAQVEPYAYPCGPDPALPEWLKAESDPEEPRGEAKDPENYADWAEIERRMAEEAERQFEIGRLHGQEEGRAAQWGGLEERLREELASLVESFASERDRYLRSVEGEVVKLSLAIAARILRREAQMDPLLLTGAVRAALGQVGASTQVRLRVPAGQLELWTEAVNLLPNLPLKPQVVPDEAMRIGDCRMEAELGSVDLGVRAQLGEIERGFFDASGQAAAEPANRASEEP